MSRQETKEKRTKEAGKKKRYENKPQTTKKMAIGTYISIITLNVNVINAPNKNKVWLNGYKNKTPVYAV